MSEDDKAELKFIVWHLAGLLFAIGLAIAGHIYIDPLIEQQEYCK